jgi:NAD+ synthase (glutamine-hydrolysing)
MLSAGEIAMLEHGFVRVAAASPQIRLGDCEHNAQAMVQMLGQADHDKVSIIVLPELCLTGYTCGDLFHQATLLQGAMEALNQVVRESKEIYSGIAVIGVPLLVGDQLFNCAAAFHNGRILGIIPKSYLPNYKEFYELRWFAPSATAKQETVRFDKAEVPFGTQLLFEATDVPGLIIGVEICEDLWMPNPPSSYQALAGATILLNLSASNDLIGKVHYRRQLVQNQSGRCIAGYAYASCGVGESTTDVVYGGHCLIAESAIILAESERFQRQSTLIIADVDLERLRLDRARTNGFGTGLLYGQSKKEFSRISFNLRQKQWVHFGQKHQPAQDRLRRRVEAHPFVPSGQEQLRERCQEIFSIQVAGLARRLEQIDNPPVTIGISGGLDSTLALLVACKTFDVLGVDRKQIRALTMPGFGTSKRTRVNALALMRELGVTGAEVDIRALCLEEMRALKHTPFGIDSAKLSLEEFQQRLLQVAPERRQDLVFENVQARMRMNLLMNSGFVIGTGDLSELALGWCTYNGDHMSMYNPNVSIPKTLVKFLVRWAAEHEFTGDVQHLLLDIVATEISPELLPLAHEGAAGESTESAIGPYELHDFFLYHFLRFGFGPEKILFLAGQTEFSKPYSAEQIASWLRVFIRRFFANQFKRSCLPDGPKVGSISLSPRGDWRMPSDAQAALWLKWAEPGS